MSGISRKFIQEPIFKLRQTIQVRLPLVIRDANGNLRLSEQTSTGIAYKDFNFRLLESITYDAPQGIVQQESVSSDGGSTINTGRKIESLTLTGKLLNRQEVKFNRDSVTINTIETFSDIRDKLLELKDNSTQCELVGHQFLNFKNRKWIITNINTNLNAGQNYLVFTISLKEYRQANVKRATLNLVAGKNIIDFNNRLQLSLQRI